MLLQKIAGIVTKKPLAIVVGVIVISILMVAQMALNPQDGTVSQSSFLPDNEVISAIEDIGDKFATEYPVDTLVYSKNDDILTSDAFVEILEIEIALIENELIANNSLTPSNPSTDIVAIPNYLAPFVEGDASDLQELKEIYANKTDQEIKDAFNSAKQNPLLAGVVINILGEYDGDNSAKATKITFKFDNSQREGEGTTEAFDRMVSVELEMAAVVKGMEFESVEPHALGQAVLDNAINDASNENTDQLFMLVIILVIGVLFATFRSPVDVVLTMFALMMAIIWSNGFASLLQFEPSFFAVIVPILLVGLGVDYGIHLVMRYREELVEDWNIDKASSSSVVFVGSALLLATTTTMVGFLSNVASDITPIREFGIQVAIGVLSAFLIFVTFIPACRILIDRRYEAKGQKLLSDTNEKIIRGRKAATNAARGEAERTVPGKVDDLRAKIAEFKEKGINTDELERVLAECEAEMGAVLVELQSPRHALPWLALACGLLCVLAAWLAVSAAVEALAVLGGVVLLLVAFYGFRPPVSREQRAAIEEGEQAGILDNFMELGAKVAIENPQRVLAVVAVITLITGYGAMGISTEFNFNDFLPEEVEITEHFHYLQDEFSTSNEFSFIYISGSVATFDVFNQINNTQTELSDGDDWVNPDQSMMFSPLNGMRDLASNNSDINPFDFYNSTFEELFNSNDADGDLVPDSDEGVRELLDWIMLGDGKQIPNMVSNFVYYDEETDDYTVAYILVNTKSKNAYFSEVVGELEKDSEGLETLETEGKVDSVVVTGAPAIIDVVVNTINETMMGSIIYTIILSFIILTAIFGYVDKQPWLGPLTMVPVLLVLVWILGTMVAIGYALNVFTILIGALTVGLGVTYAIHISHRFIEEMEHHHSLEKAVNNTVKNTGSALFGAAMTTVLGFGVLFFAILPPMKQFGTMTALTIFYSFLSSVWVLPSLLVLWARYTNLGKVVDEQPNQDDVEEEESDEE